MFGSANSVSDGPTCASLELLLQAADIISKREQAGEPVAERVVPNDRYALTFEAVCSAGLLCARRSRSRSRSRSRWSAQRFHLRGSKKARPCPAIAAAASAYEDSA